jgi:GntR family transcriptional repressor for pyruvate dehydrogenase complex
MAKSASIASFRIAPLRRQRVSETVADQLRKAIFSGRIQPGHKLQPERELAGQFETSRVALREALRALEQEGMIRIKRGSGGGAFVAGSLNTVVKLGQATSAHLSEVRSMLEPEMARLATLRADDADLKAIEAVLLAQEEELRAGSLSRKFDMEFHRLVAGACHNPVLPVVVGAVDESIRAPILRSKLTREMRAGVVAYHRRIFDAMRSRDGDLAYSIMKDHVAAVQDHLRESEDPESAAAEA